MAINKTITEQILHSELELFEAKLFEKLELRFGEMRDEMRKTNERIVAPVREMADKTYKWVFGNGDPGADERLRNIERQITHASRALWVLAVSVGGYIAVEIVKVLIEHL